MSTVWLVEQGEYSDYHVAGIFSTEMQAREFASHYKSDAGVREYELNIWTEEQAQFIFTFDLQGNITATSEVAFTDPAPPEDEAQSGCVNSGEILISVNRGPRERAVKIASEYYARIRACLDEANVRVETAHALGRLQCYGMGRGGSWLAHGVARILAGLDKLPARENASMYSADILEIFAMAGVQ